MPPEIAVPVACHALQRYRLSSRAHSPALPSRQRYHVGRRTGQASAGVGSDTALDRRRESQFFLVQESQRDNIPARLLWRDDKEEKNK